ncbi:MAG TPA: cytochrome c oxidase accessory protein CcoG [Burkholderiaceae bacterium]|nr:cytochrome c oxidase accessory protein CcoG [Burkholderiaceae bacterium]
MTAGVATGPATRRVIPIVADTATPEWVSLYQSEAKIQSRSVTGWFAGWRWALVWLTQLVFYGLPWLQWGGRQAVLFDLAARRFYIFGLVLYPQDFIYLAGLLVLSAFSLFLFTAVAGRLWCGFACPQTVYTEIFMWVERRFEGDRQARIKLDHARWTWSKLRQRGAKQFVWLAIGLWTGFTFVAYFTPARSLVTAAMSLTLGPWEWFWSLFYGFATYGNAGYMREQVCKYMCPYARFQSAMFDRDTLVISYDATRGEPRGPRARGVPSASIGKGDCVNCTLCVQVCPTGIDIRDGLQYECIGCTACIDACNGVMDKVGYSRGLIRYATERGMEERSTSAQLWRHVFRPRILVYTAVLLLITFGVVASLVTRSPFRADVVRDRGSMGRMVEDGRIENVYRVQLMNASESRQHFRIEVDGLPQAKLVSNPETDVDATQARWLPVAVQIPPEAAASLGAGVHPFKFTIVLLEGGRVAHSMTEKSTFVVPR